MVFESCLVNCWRHAEGYALSKDEELLNCHVSVLRVCLRRDDGYCHCCGYVKFPIVRVCSEKKAQHFAARSLESGVLDTSKSIPERRILSLVRSRGDRATPPSCNETQPGKYFSRVQGGVNFLPLPQDQSLPRIHRRSCCILAFDEVVNAGLALLQTCAETFSKRRARKAIAAAVEHLPRKALLVLNYFI